MSQSAAGYLRKILNREQAGKPSDAEMVAIGMLAIADSLDNVSASLDNVAKETRDSDGVSTKLGDVADALAVAINHYWTVTSPVMVSHLVLQSGAGDCELIVW